MANKLIVTFLGTSSSSPQPKRNQSCICANYRDYTIIFDMGEGAQSRMVEYGMGFGKNSLICLTHLHADHTLGLIGYLTTRNMNDVDHPIIIIGPPGTSTFVTLLLYTYRVLPGYPIEIIETPGNEIVFSTSNFAIEAFTVNHRQKCFGYKLTTFTSFGKFNVKKAKELQVPKGKQWQRFKEGYPLSQEDRIIYPSDILDPNPAKGIRLVYSGDTAFDDRVISQAYESDLLIHEATFPACDRKRAMQYKHSTNIDAGIVAKYAKAQKLIMTHLSPIYPRDKSKYLEQTQSFFTNSQFAYDGLKIVIEGS